MRLHSTYLSTKPEIKASMHMSGPQEVGVEGGIPDWIGDAFQADAKLLMVTVSYENGGVIYQRLP